MLRRGVIVGLCVTTALAAWVLSVGTLRGLAGQGMSLARVLDFDEALPLLPRDVARDWRTNPARGPADPRTRLVALQFITGDEAGGVMLSCVLEPPSPQSRIRWRRGLLVRASVSERPGRPAGAREAVVTRPPLRFGRAIALAAALAVTLVALSPVTGLKVLACVALLWAFGKVFLAGLLAGLPPLPVTLVFSLVVVSGTVLVIAGPRREGLAALAGVAAAVVATGAIAAVSSRALGITGLDSTGARFLLDMASGRDAAFDFRSLALSGTMIVVLGASCDLAVGISSAVAAWSASRPDAGRRGSFEYGLAVGRDTGVTMVLTLVFAFVGLELPAFLFPRVAGLSPAEVANSEAGVIEIGRVLIACTGLVLTIPVTAFASSVLLARRGRAQKASRLTRLVESFRSPSRRTLLGLLTCEAAAAGALLVTALAMGSAFRFPLPWQEDQDTPSAHVAAARAAFDEGRPALAAVRLWRARELHPTDARADAETRVWLGHACYLMGWPEQAARELEAASGLAPDDAQPLQYLGRIYSEAGRHDLAARALEAGVGLRPDDPEMLCDLAAALTGAGEWDRARRLAKRALRLDPDSGRAKDVLDATAGSVPAH